MEICLQPASSESSARLLTAFRVKKLFVVELGVRQKAPDLSHFFLFDMY